MENVLDATVCKVADGRDVCCQVRNKNCSEGGMVLIKYESLGCSDVDMKMRTAMIGRAKRAALISFFIQQALPKITTSQQANNGSSFSTTGEDLKFAQSPFVR